MRLLIVGCRSDTVDTLRRMRVAPALRPLHLCFWDPDIETARRLLHAVGAGTCLREVTPALLVHVDVVLLFDQGHESMLARRHPLPAVVAVHPLETNGLACARAAILQRRILVSYRNDTTPEHRVVSGILFRSMGEMISVPESTLCEAAWLAQAFDELIAKA